MGKRFLAWLFRYRPSRTDQLMLMMQQQQMQMMELAKGMVEAVKSQSDVFGNYLKMVTAHIEEPNRVMGMSDAEEALLERRRELQSRKDNPDLDAFLEEQRKLQDNALYGPRGLQGLVRDLSSEI